MTIRAIDPHAHSRTLPTVPIVAKISKRLPQLRQAYSYVGIGDPPDNYEREPNDYESNGVPNAIAAMLLLLIALVAARRSISCCHPWHRFAIERHC
jgi:hypothetical protein